MARHVVRILNVHCNELRHLFHGWIGCLCVNGLAGGVFNPICLTLGAETVSAPLLLHANRWVAYELFATYCSSRMEKQATC